MAVVDHQLQLQHLAWRAGFGETLPTISAWEHKRRKEIVNKVLIGKTRKAVEDVSVVSADDLPGFRPKKDMTADERKKLQQMNNDGIKDLNVAWVNAMIRSEHPLREKISLFWHGHFACRTQNVLFNQQLLGVIRENALGKFGDLLTAVSKSPAMLQFLNNQQNRKQHPNENFAREVMELFTLGRGNYTEQDVKEAARAFTGWGFDGDGAFVFREKQHDDGEKIFLGKRGNWNGDDVLKILLEQPQTATFITRKLYRFFVADDADEEKVAQLSKKFYQSGYDIRSLMKEIFMADWFYDGSLVGNKIKSPVELLVGIRRTVPMNFEKEEVMLVFQRVLGQLLFYPPNVAGWPGGRSWIDSSSLMFRLRVPQVIFYSDNLNIRPKEITPEMGEGNNYKMTLEINEFLKRQYAKKVNAKISWESYLKGYEDISRSDLSKAIANSLLQNRNIDTALLEKYADASSRENYIKTVTIDVMSTPEYQLC
ncbi:Uncharacterized conserved protein, DUF1800 family [Chitinophaga terrae (ex Kim and Jung 2007)]|uniref:Uncharacterized conserved protein, DUF1800 family n=1 Tax=Chitinophaga terrae (ex Kim and Jung 2007) TaxID=408074 RepID=A0A1H4CT19_9BACT|nr:DUF1800 domain-containing protein [Chitinophaga terrae (ex Kim and Jung 2007)]GEP90441.1 hypothetical protein CTE07_20860 [Chitinophaga terrae (ex Kim and Jung 2007)]SEA63471.1 Uncharacterized conserved protein, DUF1800 family [Chitinophaga terrae (ex Kim and Jung 2007)]